LVKNVFFVHYAGRFWGEKIVTECYKC